MVGSIKFDFTQESQPVPLERLKPNKVYRRDVLCAGESDMHMNEIYSNMSSCASSQDSVMNIVDSYMYPGSHLVESPATPVQFKDKGDSPKPESVVDIQPVSPKEASSAVSAPSAHVNSNSSSESLAVEADVDTSPALPTTTPTSSVSDSRSLTTSVKRTSNDSAGGLVCDKCNKTYKLKTYYDRHVESCTSKRSRATASVGGASKPRVSVGKSRSPPVLRKVDNGDNTDCSVPDGRGSVLARGSLRTSTPSTESIEYHKTAAQRELGVSDSYIDYFKRCESLNDHKNNSKFKLPDYLLAPIGEEVKLVAKSKEKNAKNKLAQHIRELNKELQNKILNAKKALRNCKSTTEEHRQLYNEIKFLRAYKTIKMSEYYYTPFKITAFHKRLQSTWSNLKQSTVPAKAIRTSLVGLGNNIKTLDPELIEEIAKSVTNFLSLVIMYLLLMQVNSRKSIKLTECSVTLPMIFHVTVNSNKSSYSLPDHSKMKTPGGGTLMIFAMRNLLHLMNVKTVDKAYEIITSGFEDDMRVVYLRLMVAFKTSRTFIECLCRLYTMYLCACHFAIMRMAKKNGTFQANMFHVIQNCSWFAFKELANMDSVDLTPTLTKLVKVFTMSSTNNQAIDLNDDAYKSAGLSSLAPVIESCTVVGGGVAAGAVATAPCNDSNSSNQSSYKECSVSESEVDKVRTANTSASRKRVRSKRKAVTKLPQKPPTSRSTVDDTGNETSSSDDDY